ncbi:hypothetical protein [Pseudomonas sp. Q2-TVG4-2]|uniref:hypothetical protein n=1 Tax=Pseudomonas sp. Q2-TVG4-2 TaxID=1685699 RepID=UPI0015E7DCF5
MAKLKRSEAAGISGRRAARNLGIHIPAGAAGSRLDQPSTAAVVLAPMLTAGLIYLAGARLYYLRAGHQPQAVPSRR